MSFRTTQAAQMLETVVSTMDELRSSLQQLDEAEKLFDSEREDAALQFNTPRSYRSPTAEAASADVAGGGVPPAGAGSGRGAPGLSRHGPSPLARQAVLAAGLNVTVPPSPQPAPATTDVGEEDGEEGAAGSARRPSSRGFGTPVSGSSPSARRRLTALKMKELQ